MKQDKGVAGLTIFLSLITMLFIIGLLVMIFALMGGELIGATYTSTSATVTNETGGWINSTTYTVDNSGANGFSGLTVTALINATDNTSISVANVTVSGSGFTNATATTWDDVLVSYTYTYDADNTATSVMNDTASGIATVTNWFPIFIVISAMVVLILLTIIIIAAIKSSGLIVEGGA